MGNVITFSNILEKQTLNNNKLIKTQIEVIISFIFSPIKSSAICSKTLLFSFYTPFLDVLLAKAVFYFKST